MYAEGYGRVCRQIVRQPGFGVERIGEVLVERRPFEMSQSCDLQTKRIDGEGRGVEVLCAAINIRHDAVTDSDALFRSVTAGDNDGVAAYGDRGAVEEVWMCYLGPPPSPHYPRRRQHLRRNTRRPR